ncbi:hypothetical protein RCL1_005684 [Eukaryota sp. TZLM3-RCL]
MTTHYLLTIAMGDYEEEFRRIKEEFPKAKFVISMDYADLDKPLARADVRTLQLNAGCRCYSRTIDVHQKEPGKPITRRDVINAMIANNYDSRCDHVFLESLDRFGTSITTFFGS